MRRCCGLVNVHVSSSLLVGTLDVDSHVDFLKRCRGCCYAMWDLKDLVGDVFGGKEKATDLSQLAKKTKLS